MDIESYRQRRRELAIAEPRFRDLCLKCRQPGFSCYCQHVSRFDPGIKFVILIHPIEVKRRIATGRMSHLCLEGSELIAGEDFSTNPSVNHILSDDSHHHVILYPGQSATNLSALSPIERKGLFPSDKKLAVFVIDGTWSTAKKMLNRSPNLQSLSQICFTPSKPSTFRVRKQPAPGCYSTIEAIHETTELLGDTQGFDTTSRRHDNLLEVFDSFVEKQLECIEKYRASRHTLKYRRDRKRSA